MKKLSLIKILPLAILLLGLGAFYYFHLEHFINFQALKLHRELLLNYIAHSFFIATIMFILIYIILVAISAPGAFILTIIGGFLFGPVLGTIFAVISATIGAVIIFVAARTALHDFLYKISAKWFQTFAQGFKSNAFSYLLFLRLVPLFPFWLINIVPAFFEVSARVFVVTTFFGIIPGTFVYVMLGNGLGEILDQGKVPNLNIIFEPAIFIPIVGLAILALLPILYQLLQKHNS